jgi:hypothetical protein
LNGCSSEPLKESPTTLKKASNSKNISPISLTASTLNCDVRAEQTDYSIYRMVSDGIHIGDVMPYYDPTISSFYVYYLKDIWGKGGTTEMQNVLLPANGKGRLFYCKMYYKQVRVTF